MPIYNSFCGSERALNTAFAHEYWQRLLNAVREDLNFGGARQGRISELSAFGYPVRPVVCDLSDSMAPTPHFVARSRTVEFHYCLGGNERILWVDVELDFPKLAIPYDDDSYTTQYQAPDDFRTIALHGGDFCILFPGEAYLDLRYSGFYCLEECHLESRDFVKKFVISIPAEDIPAECRMSHACASH